VFVVIALQAQRKENPDPFVGSPIRSFLRRSMAKQGEAEVHPVAAEFIDFLNASPTAFHAVGKFQFILREMCKCYPEDLLKSCDRGWM
jgi:hypothetical protein